MIKELCFRGSGLLFPWYIGLYTMLVRLGRIDPRTIHLRGMSSGALVATALICGINCHHMVVWFESLIVQYWLKCGYHSVSALLGNLHHRWLLIGKIMKHLIHDDIARQCTGRLTIVAFSLKKFKLVQNNEWRDTTHLIDWVLASMSLPLTSLYRVVDGDILIDPYNFDLYWPFNRDYCRPRHCVMASPIEKHLTITYQSNFSWLDSILLPTQNAYQYRERLYRAGFTSAIQHWLKFI